MSTEFFHNFKFVSKQHHLYHVFSLDVHCKPWKERSEYLRTFGLKPGVNEAVESNLIVGAWGYWKTPQDQYGDILFWVVSKVFCGLKRFSHVYIGIVVK